MANEFDKVEQIYQVHGIVTRKEVKSLDMRSFAEDAYKKLREKGYQSCYCHEVSNSDWSDYSSVIFDLEHHSLEEIEQYMRSNVLEK